MVDFLSLFVGGSLLVLVLKFIVIQKIVDGVIFIFTNKYIIIGCLIGIALFVWIPDVVVPYYTLVFEYVINGFVSLWNLTLGWLTEMIVNELK